MSDPNLICKICGHHGDDHFFNRPIMCTKCPDQDCQDAGDPAMSDDLVTWLRAQLDEVEVMARAAAVFTAGDRWIAAAAVFIAGDRWIADGDEVFGASDDGANVATAATWSHAEHIAHWDPARVLAEVEAKRALIEETIRPWLGNDQTTGRIAWTALRLLAWPYVDRPGYREEWAP